MKRSLVGAIGLVAAALAVVGGASGATPASQGGKLAFIRSTDAESHLFVMNDDGSKQRQLTSGASFDFAHAWSPDGRRLAFVRWVKSNGRDIYAINADGSGLRQLTGSTASMGPSFWEDMPAWSPDGGTIAYASSGVVDGERRYGIYLMNGDGRGKRRLARLPWYNRPGWPAWSPDGRKIAFATAGGVIFVINADGTGQRRLTHRHDFPYGFYGPTWSPDGRRVGFMTMPGRYDSIYVVDLAGGRERLVTRHAYTEAGFAWRPDGRGIIYARERRGGVYTINLDGSGDHRVTRIPPRRDLFGSLSLSPDQRTIAYASDITGQGDIYLVNRDGSGRRRLTDTAEIEGAPIWSPLPRPRR
jgi:Tol biopolymer transport system component